MGKVTEPKVDRRRCREIDTDKETENRDIQRHPETPIDSQRQHETTRDRHKDGHTLVPSRVF